MSDAALEGAVAALEHAIPPGERLLLDTTAVAAYLDASEPTHAVARVLIDGLVADGRNPTAVSAVTAMELLIRPLRPSPPTDHVVLTFLEHQPNLAILPVDLGVARVAARIRAAHRFAPPDALVIGSAIAHGIRTLVTNDFEWGRKLEGLELAPGQAIRVITLAEVGEP